MMPIEIPCLDLPCLLPGALAVDDRGEIRFCNEFDPLALGIRRQYLVGNHRAGQVRAWHGHKRERKWVMAVGGAAVVAAIKVEDWEGRHDPPPDVWPVAKVHRFVLSSSQPAILAIPAGYANGWMSLTGDCLLLWFSSATVEESKEDDYRFDARLWKPDPWRVEER